MAGGGIGLDDSGPQVNPTNGGLRYLILWLYLDRQSI